MKGKLSSVSDTLTFKIVAVILVCSLVPLGATTYISLSQADEMLDHKSTARQAEEAGSVAQNVKVRSEFYKKQVRQIKQHPSVQELARQRYENESLGDAAKSYERGTGYPKVLGEDPTYQRTQEYFSDVAADNPSIDMIRVFWRDGNVLSGYKLGEEDTADYKGDKGWFKDVVERKTVGEDEVYVSAINIARATDSPAIRYAMPIVVDGERVGLVIVNYEAKQITGPVNDIQLGDSGYGMLIDPAYQNAEGEVIGAAYVANGRNPDLAFNTSAAGNLAISASQLSGDSGSLTFRKDGYEWHGQYERVKLASGREYYVVATVHSVEMNAAQRTIKRDSLLIAGIAALLVVGVGVLMSRRITKPITNVAEDAEAVADGDLDHEIRRSESSSEIEMLTDSIATMKQNVVTALDDAEAAKQEAETESERAQQAKQEAEAAKQEAEMLSSAIESKADDYSEVMAAAADGDLTRRMDTDSRSDAMTEIADAFNEMMDQLESTIVEIQQFAERVDDASGRVTDNADEVERTSEEVSDSIQDISSGATEQNENLQEVSGEMNSLSATIEEIASSASEVADVSQQAAEVGESGSEHASVALDEMDRIEETADSAMDKVESLDEEMAAIGEIVELIDDIAEQTNLLALNASIEAARAGEAGEGFAVVADEIKSLAEETAGATTEIADLIGEVQASTNDTVEDVSEMQERLSAGMGTIESALDSLDEVVESVEDVNDGIQSISEATDDQAASTEETVAMLDEVANTSTETAAEAQTVAAASEQATSAIAEVSESAASLSRQSDDLKEQLEQFEVSATGLAEDDGASEMEFGQIASATDD